MNPLPLVAIYDPQELLSLHGYILALAVLGA
jgi:hypothetical protein